MNSELFFNLGSWGYDLMTDQDLWREQITAVLEHAIDPDGIHRVLDLGCGPGVSTFALAERLPHAQVDGIDLARKMIDRARRHHERNFAHLDNVSFRVADATQLPYDDSEYDLAVGHSFLYLVPDRAAVLSEVRRVVAPGGSLVLMEPNGRGNLREASQRSFGRDLDGAPWFDSARFRTSMVLWRLVSGNVGRLDPDEVTAWLRSAGFNRAATVSTLGGLGMHCIGRVDHGVENRVGNRVEQEENYGPEPEYS